MLHIRIVTMIGGTDNSNVNTEQPQLRREQRCQLLTDSEQLKPQQPTWKNKKTPTTKTTRTTNRNWSIRQTCPNHSINIDVIQSWPEPEPKKVACNITIPVTHVSINWVYNVKICLSQKNVVYNVKIYVSQKNGVYNVNIYVSQKMEVTTSKFA